MEKVEKGQKIKVSNNEIFKIMGFDVVTGTVAVVSTHGKSVSIVCDQTGCFELVDLDDGVIEIIR